LGLLLTQNVAIRLGHTLSPRLRINGEKFIHQRHDPDRRLIFGVEFNRGRKLAPCMRLILCT
jgi:hypothetical protein